MSPALAGRLSTTAPPGKPNSEDFKSGKEKQNLGIGLFLAHQEPAEVLIVYLIGWLKARFSHGPGWMKLKGQHFFFFFFLSNVKRIQRIGRININNSSRFFNE